MAQTPAPLSRTASHVQYFHICTCVAEHGLIIAIGLLVQHSQANTNYRFKYVSCIMKAIQIII